MAEVGADFSGAWTGGVIYADVGMFYITVVQEVILYGLDTWLMSSQIWKTLGGFHHQLVWRLMGQIPQRNLDSTWTYPSSEEAMSEVETYIACFQNTIAQFIVTRPIMYLCLAAVWRPGAWI